MFRYTGAGSGVASSSIRVEGGIAGWRGARATLRPAPHAWILTLAAAMALVVAASCSTALYLRKRHSAKQLGHLSGIFPISVGFYYVNIFPRFISIY